MEHEDGIDMSRDRFFKKGIKIMEKEARECQESRGSEEEEKESGETIHGSNDSEEIELLCGRIKKEELKKELQQALEGI
jgi:hypothetical protein